MAKNTTNIDDLLKANTRRTPGSTCTIGVALAAMDPATRAKIEVAIDDRARFANTGLAAVLRELGHDVGTSSMERHRAKGCKCRT